MKQTFSKLTSVLLAAILAVCTLQVAVCAKEDNQTQLTIISSNVAGLPIPSAFSDSKKVVPDAQVEIGKILNATGADIICVQEDFQFHAKLAQQMTDYPYQTYTSGGVPTGDGLNIFSKYPIYNVERVAWEEFYGILTDANDGLTPKGLLKCTVDADGVLADVYDIHLDAYGTEQDQMAKKAQLKQLSSYIKEHSADRPVLITGDFNCTLHTDYHADLYQIMIQDAGFADSWANVVNSGNYFRGDDAAILISNYYRQYNGLYWGIWDSVERLLYRDGTGTVITPTSFVYKNCTNDPEKPEALTDHSLMISTVSIDTSSYVRPALELKKEHQKCFIVRFFHSVYMVFKCIGLIIYDGFRLLKEKIAAK